MKNIYRLAASALAFTVIGIQTNAQSTATASTTATLITPISISKTFDMDFGTVAASQTAGTIVLDCADGTTSTGGASVPAGSAPKTAVFSVAGEGNSGFSISIATSAITLNGPFDPATLLRLQGHKIEALPQSFRTSWVSQTKKNRC